jgi:hypothetical protein
MASKTKVEIISIQFKNGDQWAIGDNTRGDDGDPVTNIRFERDGYNKQRQIAGPVYVIETEDGFRSIHPADTLECLGVKVTKEENRNTRELPDGAQVVMAEPADNQVETFPEEVDEDITDLDLDMDFPAVKRDADDYDNRQPERF